MNADQIATLINVGIPLLAGVGMLLSAAMIPKEDIHPQRSKRKRLLNVGGGLLLVAAGLLSVSSLGSSATAEPAQPTAEYLRSLVDAGNPKLPKRIDEYTTLERLGSSGSTLTAFYTLHNLDFENMTEQAFEEAARPGLIQQLSRQPAISDFRDRSITMEYVYQSEDKLFFCVIAIGPGEY